jgi:hypothetical protein
VQGQAGGVHKNRGDAGVDWPEVPGPERRRRDLARRTRRWDGSQGNWCCDKSGIRQVHWAIPSGQIPSTLKSAWEGPQDLFVLSTATTSVYSSSIGTSPKRGGKTIPAS